MDASQLTIRFAQDHQPWMVPYSGGVLIAAAAHVPHILASHAVLHAAKSVGKLASVFEGADHGKPVDAGLVSDMTADLVTAALRLANLYKFDLAAALVERVKEKNGVGFSPD
jgi:hypothetical protein